ncbi:hypothetical protein V8F33_002727 [Rhypophila sp. PSN 637]
MSNLLSSTVLFLAQQRPTETGAVGQSDGTGGQRGKGRRGEWRAGKKEPNSQAKLEALSIARDTVRAGTEVENGSEQIRKRRARGKPEAQERVQDPGEGHRGRCGLLMTIRRGLDLALLIIIPRFQVGFDVAHVGCQIKSRTPGASRTTSKTTTQKLAGMAGTRVTKRGGPIRDTLASLGWEGTHNHAESLVHRSYGTCNPVPYAKQAPLLQATAAVSKSVPLRMYRGVDIPYDRQQQVQIACYGWYNTDSAPEWTLGHSHQPGTGLWYFAKLNEPNGPGWLQISWPFLGERRSGIPVPAWHGSFLGEEKPWEEEKRGVERWGDTWRFNSKNCWLQFTRWFTGSAMPPQAGELEFRLSDSLQWAMAGEK